MTLKVENLSVEVGDFRIEDLNLSVGKGEYLVVFGPSGSGKSTLLETIAGFRKPKGGRILLDGRDITYLPPERREIAVVYQDFLLFPHMSVFENIAFGLLKREKNREVVEKKVLEIAKNLGVEHLLNKKPSLLSGGERQRVALARAVVYEPKLLLLDEPLSALDPANRERLRSFLKKAVKGRGITTIHVSHDFADAENLADKVAVLFKGKLLEVGNFEEVFFTPTSEEVAKFLEVNGLRGKLLKLDGKTATIEVCGKRLISKRVKKNAKPGEVVRLLFRPEVVRLGGDNSIGCKVLEIYRERFLLKLLLNCCGFDVKAYLPFEFEKVLTKEVELSIPPEFLFVV